jgi:pentatricopeptide repeat protein
LANRFAGAAEALLSPDAIINTTGYPDTSDALPGGVEEALAQLEAIKAGGRTMSDSSAQAEGAAAMTLPVVMTASEEECYRIARTFALAGSSDKVSDLICTMKEKNIPLSARIYAQAMLAANNHGRYQHAIDTFQLMLKEGFEPSSDAWGFLVQAHVSFGQLEEARKVVSGLVRAGLRVTTPIYNALIEAALAEKDYAKAEELFVEMKGVSCGYAFRWHYVERLLAESRASSFVPSFSRTELNPTFGRTRS